MSASARPRRKEKGLSTLTAGRFLRKVAETPGSDPEPKPNGLPAHPFAVEEITIRNSKRQVVRQLDSVACRAWADYGLKGTP